MLYLISPKPAASHLARDFSDVSVLIWRDCELERRDPRRDSWRDPWRDLRDRTSADVMRCGVEKLSEVVERVLLHFWISFSASPEGRGLWGRPVTADPMSWRSFESASSSLGSSWLLNRDLVRARPTSWCSASRETGRASNSSLRLLLARDDIRSSSSWLLLNSGVGHLLRGSVWEASSGEMYDLMDFIVAMSTLWNERQSLVRHTSWSSQMMRQRRQVVGSGAYPQGVRLKLPKRNGRCSDQAHDEVVDTGLLRAWSSFNRDRLAPY